MTAAAVPGVDADAEEVADGWVTPAVLAEHMGWSRFRAYREMLAVERMHPGVVQRRMPGNRLVAEAVRIGPYIRGMRPTRLEREVGLLRARVGQLEDRLDAEVRARLEFQRVAHAWFAGRT